MKILTPDEMPAGTKAEYPWDQWFDGRIRLLEQGIDFTVSAKSMQLQAHQRSRIDGVRIGTRITDDGDLVLWVKGLR